MVMNTTIFIIFVTLTSATAQTFQYSRGWTNGKRADKSDDVRDVAANLERILSPCQMNKLKYVLEGKPFSERLLAPCEYIEEDEIRPKRYKNDHGPDLFETFQ